jgi:hypothetical protein
MSPKFGFFKRKTTGNFHEKMDQARAVNSVTDEELLEIIKEEKELREKDLIADLEPIKSSILHCLDRLRKDADELDEQEIKVENPQFESLIKTSKRILIASIKKESFLESSEIKNYEDAVKFKNNLELLINRFGQVGDSHNRILNEFMRKQISKLKNEFDNLSSLLKRVTQILFVKESEINKNIVCRDNLILFKEKVIERKRTKDRLSELMEEIGTIDKNIERSKREYDDLQKSEEFLNTSNTLEQIDEKKNEIVMYEKKIINVVSNLSRPITKFSYLASKETQGRLTILQNQPLEIFNYSSQYLQLFNELRKHVVERSIQIKDPEKTIHQIDEFVNSLPSMSSNLKNLEDELRQLKSSVNSKNTGRLQEIKAKIEMYEKYRSENVSKIGETKISVNELDSIIEVLKKKIEENAFEITNTKYSIQDKTTN